MMKNKYCVLNLSSDILKMCFENRKKYHKMQKRRFGEDGTLTIERADVR